MYSKLKSGDLLHRSKGIVQHAGVYLGNELVLHNQPGKGANITSYHDYAEGKEVNVTSAYGADIQQIASRLKDIIENDNQYQFLTNNCEHIAYHLIHGKKLSPQLQGAMLGMAISKKIASRIKNSNLLLWLAGGALFGLVFNNLTQKYDYTIYP